MLVEVLEAAGYDPALLVEGTSLSLDALRDVRGWLDWDTFIELNERAIAITAERMTPAELGAHLAHVPSHTFVRAMAGRVLTPRHLFQIGSRWLIPNLFPMLRLDFRPHTDGTFVLEGSLPPAYRSSEGFFLMVGGAMAEITALVGGRRAEVDVRILDPRRVDFHIHAPSEPPLRERALQAVRAALRVPETLALIVRQQTEIDESVKVLSRTRRDFQRLLEEMPNAVAIHREGRVLWANAAFARVFGVPEGGSLTGKALVDFVRAEDRAVAEATLANPGARSPRVAEWRVERDDGTIGWVEVEQTASVDFDGQPATLLAASDVSEQRRLREQLRVADRMASLGTLAATLGHDLSNPLAFVIAQLEVGRTALADGDIQRVAEALETARDGADRLSSVVSNLRSRARGEAPAAARVDVRVVVRQAARVARETSTSHAELIEDLAEVPLVAGDGAGLGQVFLNLVVNALEAIPADAADRAVRIRSATGDDGVVLVSVADTGAGIPDDVKGRIFLPFFTTKSNGGNAGLGLAICARIVEEHGGSISVRSVPPGEPLRRGERFRTEIVVRLPAASRWALPRDAEPSSRPRRRVLFVDDEPNLLRSIELLVSAHHDVVCAASGEAAIGLIEASPPFDAVVCDLMMPGKDGIDVFEAVTRGHPELGPRFVFMTGGAYTERVREFLDRSANLRLDKPFATEAVLEAIESVSTATP